jgi:hypothetical protein
MLGRDVRQVTHPTRAFRYERANLLMSRATGAAPEESL